MTPCITVVTYVGTHRTIAGERLDTHRCFFPIVAIIDVIANSNSSLPEARERKRETLMVLLLRPITFPSSRARERLRARGFFEINEPRDSRLFAKRRIRARAIEPAVTANYLPGWTTWRKIRTLYPRRRIISRSAGASEIMSHIIVCQVSTCARYATVSRTQRTKMNAVQWSRILRALPHQRDILLD